MKEVFEKTLSEAKDALGLDFLVLHTPPPTAHSGDAVSIALEHYGLQAQVESLSGERDRNYRLVAKDQPSLTLKFINTAEPPQETDMQVQVLNHLAQCHCPVTVPTPVATLRGRSGFTCQLHGSTVRGRAYTYLPGLSAAQAPVSAPLRHAIGQIAAQLDVAMRDFQHVAAERVFPWNLMHLPVLAPLTQYLPQDSFGDFIAQFLLQYQSEFLPRLNTLPQQVIHGDLSKSNMLVDPQQPFLVQGVLDFGDMVHGPAVADLAVAASYHMGDAEDPLAALADMQAGYESVQPLSAEERALLPVLVMGRLVQRILIPEWRAAKFPENRDYILRSNAAARVLLNQLLQIWAPCGRVEADA